MHRLCTITLLKTDVFKGCGCCPPFCSNFLSYHSFAINIQRRTSLQRSSVSIWLFFYSPFRVSKKSPIVKMRNFGGRRFVYPWVIRYTTPLYINKLCNTCCARHFDLLRKANPTVPTYADELGLFVLTPLLTSVSLSKNRFFDRPKGAVKKQPN